MTSFLWHDYETFGVNPRYDRPAQFAAIRTDLDFNPIGEPIELFCQPPMDMPPSPEACLITGITPQQAETRGLPEPAFIEAVLNELGQADTIGVGYNSLRFDDEVTRHTAWRNFHDPYAREWRNGCARWDIIDMVRLTYALRPDGIEWPRRDDGAPSFKLEHLAAANGLEQQRAHDAVSDVRATIALAALIRARQPRLYDFVWTHRDKASAKAQLDLDRHVPVLHVSEKFPADQGCLSLVMPICPHPTNKNAVLVYDLRHDPEALIELSAVDVHERIFTPQADLPEDIDRIALKGIHINRAPVLVPVNTLKPAQAERLQLDLEQCRRHWKRLAESLDIVADKVSTAFAMAEFDAPGDPEQDLYGGFVDDDDRRLCQQILRAAPAEFDGLELPFRDKRLHELLLRYRGRYYPESLNEAERNEWNQFRSNRLEFAPDGGLSLDAYDAAIAALRPGLASEPDKLALLDDLSAWGQQLRATL